MADGGPIARAARPGVFGLAREHDALAGRVEAHEAVCAERMAAIEAALARQERALAAFAAELAAHAASVDRRFAQLNAAAWSAAAGLGVGAAGVIGFLALRVWPV